MTTKSTVLDIGAGTGVWAVAAAKLGARHVVALEREPILARLIAELARENGVGDRVEVVTADALEWKTRQKFSLLVCELIGNTTFDENIIPIVDHCRRFLLPKARIIPERATLMGAPIAYRKSFDATGLPFSSAPLFALLRQVPLRAYFSDFKLSATPKALASYTPSKNNHVDLRRLRASFRVAGKPIDGFALWAEADLGYGVQLSARDCTNWQPIIFSVDERFQPTGNVSFSLDYTTHEWQVTAPKRTPMSHGPEYAYLHLRRGPD